MSTRLLAVYQPEAWVDHTFRFLSAALPFEHRLVTISLEDAHRNGLPPHDAAIVYAPRGADAIGAGLHIPQIAWGGYRTEPGMERTYCGQGAGLQVEYRDDLISYLFERISCKAEYEQEREGRCPGSVAASITAVGYDYKRPIVDEVVSLLASDIASSIEGRNGAPLQGTGRPWREMGRFALCLTHDIDTVNWSLKTLMKQTRHAAFRAARHIGRAEYFSVIDEARRLIYKASPAADYFQMGRMKELETRRGMRSTFFFYVWTSRNRRSPVDRLYNPEYRLEGDQRLRALIAENEREGFETAVHGSYSSASSAGMLGEERARLEVISGKRIRGGRQHFLQYSQTHSIITHEEAGLAYDATLGFRDINGFRRGTTIPYYGYDHAQGRTGRVMLIPLVVMDGVVFDREHAGGEEAWEGVRAILELVERHGGACSVLWHNHVFDDRLFPRWGAYYERILDYVLERRGWAGPCGQLYDRIMNDHRFAC